MSKVFFTKEETKEEVKVKGLNERMTTREAGQHLESKRYSCNERCIVAKR